MRTDRQVQVPLEPVPRMVRSDPRLFELFLKRQPVVIEGCGLVGPSVIYSLFECQHLVDTWTLQYLESKLPEFAHWTVKESPDPFFLYSHPSKNVAEYHWTSLVEQKQRQFSDFLKVFGNQSDSPDR
jgi:hypothetical protein